MAALDADICIRAAINIDWPKFETCYFTDYLLEQISNKAMLNNLA